MEIIPEGRTSPTCGHYLFIYLWSFARWLRKRSPADVVLCTVQYVGTYLHSMTSAIPFAWKVFSIFNHNGRTLTSKRTTDDPSPWLCFVDDDAPISTAERFRAGVILSWSSSSHLQRWVRCDFEQAPKKPPVRSYSGIEAINQRQIQKRTECPR